jgi:signal transduction histidine kinase
MRRRLLGGFVLFAILAMTILLIPIGFTLDAHESATTLNALKRDTDALSALIANDLSRGGVSQATKLVHSYVHSTGRQVLVTDEHGVLIASKAKQTGDQDLLGIVRAVGSRQVSGVIAGNSVEGPQYYVAMPLPHASNRSGTIDQVKLIVTYPETVVTRAIRSDWRNLGLFGVAMLLVACLFGFIISGSLVRPLRRIGAAVESIGSGHVNVRAPTGAGPRELRRLAHAINSTATRLIGLLEAQRTFVEDASHQLRTPLTALQLHLENLEHGEGPPAPEDFSAVLAEVGRLNRLVDSLLTLARNESRSPVLAPVKVRDVARDRVDYWRPFAHERSLDLDLEPDVAPDLAAITIDGILEQVLDNLLSNAFDATPAGGRIRVGAKASGDVVELHVIDNGTGLDETERVLALRRFWRGRDNASEGTGLGLSIVDQLVRLSGGTIELRGAAGGGVDATVLLKRS